MSDFVPISTFPIALLLTSAIPQAFALIEGHNNAIKGYLYAFAYEQGTLLVLEVTGLPIHAEPCTPNIYAMHIHKGSTCTGTAQEPFKDADGHYSKQDCPHPAHSGDLPPLFSFNGKAWLALYTERFTPYDITGHTIIIHGGMDDFKTQPSGNAGAMIACGEIISFS